MTDDVIHQEVAQVAEPSAPEQVATAAPEPVEQAPEQSKESKTFSQEELDELIGKRLARERRKWERENRVQAAPQAQQAQQIKSEQFATPEEYAEALAIQKAEELLAKREQERIQSEMLETYHEREEAARDKYDDFEQVAYNPNVRITDVMAESIRASEIGPDVAYFLGSNPKEADRISRLPAILQAKEIGKIEAKLAAEPPKAKKTSNAPAPIAPIAGKGASAPSFDTTDPRSVSAMSTSEWIAAEEARLRRKLGARA